MCVCGGGSHEKEVLKRDLLKGDACVGDANGGKSSTRNESNVSLVGMLS